MTDDACTFFLPGPVWVRPEILNEMARPMVSHRSDEFASVFSTIQKRLHPLFRTTQNVFVATSSGTGVLEAALLNCVPRRALVVTCGAFSQRWFKIATRLGIEVEPLHHEWGHAIEAQKLAHHLAGRRQHYDAVCLVHNETSTGVINDIETLAEVVRTESSDSLIMVDAVSSLAAAPFEFDQWGIDVCVTSSQKGLALPPGIALFAVSKRAMEYAEKKHYRGLYFDFLEFQRNAELGAAPFTPSVPHFYALAAQLIRIIDEETIEARWRRHQTLREMTLERLPAFGELACESAEISSPTVTCVRPIGSTPDEILHRMRARGFVLGSGYGEWKEETFRIGHMGDIAIEDFGAMLDALTEVSAAARMT